ncbi:Rnc dsRNA-specific ribonuclease [Pyrenophora tritici-repentis]|nr:Rnc dsRNA-specific ribonuclease [Pyrenophora tritici-repentis]
MFDKLGHGRISRLFKENLRKTIPYQHRVNDYFWGTRGALRQHFGPKARIPELFERRDRVYFTLENQKLKWYAPAPFPHHELLDAAARVGRVEESIGYTFKYKLYCIEALKQTNSTTPLYFQGVVINTDCNRRLALLGDRALDLALSEIWFYTGNTLANYTAMSLKTVTRAALNTQGLQINLHKNLILATGATSATPNQVAETFEALLGAVYIDSGHDVEAVKRVINTLKLDQNRYLRRDDDSIAERERKENAAQRLVESIEREQDQKSMAASRKKAELRRKEKASQAEAMKENAIDQSKTTWTSLFSQFLYGVQPQAQLDKDMVNMTKQKALNTSPETEKSNSADFADRATTEVESTTIGDYLRQYTQKLLGQEPFSMKQRRKEARKEREKMKLLQEQEKKERQKHEPDTQGEKELVVQTQKESNVQEEKEVEAQAQKGSAVQEEKELEAQAQRDSDGQEKNELEAQAQKVPEVHEENELKNQAQNNSDVQEEKVLETQDQNVPEAHEEKESEEQKYTELEARKQNDGEQQIQKEEEDHREPDGLSEREKKEIKWRKEELKAGMQEDEAPLPAGLRQHAWNIANTKAGTLKRRGKPCHVYALFQEQLAEIILRQRQGSKRLERRAKLREQRRIKWHEDTPESTQEETMAAPVTSHEEEPVSAPVSKQEQVKPLEIQKPAKSVSPVQKKGKPNVERSIRQMETELIQEHQRAWQKAGTDISKPEPREGDDAPLRRPLKMTLRQRRSLAASIEQLNDKRSSMSSEEGNSHQAEVQVLPTTDVVGSAMRAHVAHERRANDRS